MVGHAGRARHGQGRRRRHRRRRAAGPASRASGRTPGQPACASPTRPRPASAARSRGAPACGDEEELFTTPERPGDDPPAHARAAGARHARRRRRRPQPQPRAGVVRAPRAATTRATGSTSCATRSCTWRRCAAKARGVPRDSSDSCRLIISVLMISALWNHRSDAGSTSAHRAVARRARPAAGQHGASLWNWVLLRGGDARRRRQPARARRATCASSRPRWSATSTSWPSDGLVERRPDPDDRRVVRVVVTPAGLERLARAARRSCTSSTPSCGDPRPSARSKSWATRCCASTTLLRASARRATSMETNGGGPMPVVDRRGDPHRAAHQGVPGRHPGGRRARPRGAPRRDLRPARPERRRQDHHRRHAHHPGDPHQRAARSSAASTSSRTRPRPSR